MRTIIEVRPPETKIHPEAEIDEALYEIELETPFECHQFLGILRTHYEDSIETDSMAAKRISQIDIHLSECDLETQKDQKAHRSFFISDQEAGILEFLLTQRAAVKGVPRLRQALVKYIALGINYRNMEPLLHNPDTRSAYEGLTVAECAVGKLALKYENIKRE